MDNIGIDTMYINCQISKSEFSDLKVKLNEALGDKFHPERKHIQDNEKQTEDKYLKNTFITYAYAKQGFRKIRLRKIHREGYTGYYLEIQFHPKLLLEPGNYIHLLFPNEFVLIEDQFNYYMEELGFPLFSEWNVMRIDVAWDITVEQDLILTYMFLFKKSNVLDFFLSTEITQEYFCESNSFYLFSKEITINFYDRYTTLLTKEEKGKKEYNNVEAAKNTLRLEVQYRKISGKLSENLNERLVQYLVPLWYYNIIGRGDYYKKKQYSEVILERVRSNKKRLRLLRLLDFIEHSGSIFAAKALFINKFLHVNEADLKKSKYTDSNRKKIIHKAGKEFSKQLNEIRELGINPVVLPEDYCMDRVDNLLDKYIYALPELNTDPPPVREISCND